MFFQCGIKTLWNSLLLFTTYLSFIILESVCFIVVFVFEIVFYPKIIKLMFLIFIFLYANIKIKKI
jgi:hypothetical protein